MKIFVIALFVVLAICTTCSGKNETQFKRANGRIIINGRDARDGEFPYQVSMQERFRYIELTQHKCGGSIIDEYHVLIAAHCVYGNYMPLHFIAAGTRDLANTYDPNRVNLTIEEAYMHEDYVHFYYLNDIAILRVSPGFPLDSRFISPIAMRTEELEAPAECTVSGWGATQYPEVEYPDILQTLDLPLIDYEVCEELYEAVQYSYFIPGMICAGYVSGVYDSCLGDSGGPLVCGGLLTGVVSWGIDCAEPNLPGVYADVAYYRDWIETTLARSYEESGLERHSSQ